MSDQKIEALEIGLYEDYLEELQKKYYGGINKVLGEPWYTRTDAEMEAEADFAAANDRASLARLSSTPYNS